METKVCTRCDRTKQGSELSKRKLSSDGLQAYCKDCSKICLSRWKQNNREYY